jgi:hypothetical protein
MRLMFRTANFTSTALLWTLRSNKQSSHRFSLGRRVLKQFPYPTTRRALRHRHQPGNDEIDPNRNPQDRHRKEDLDGICDD